MKEAIKPAEPEKPEEEDGSSRKNGTGPESWQQQIVDTGSVTTKTRRGNLHCLTIIGQIEGHMTASTATKTTNAT